VGLTF